MISYDLNKLSFSKGANIGFIVTGGIVAPYMFLYRFAPNIIDKYDLIKLLILCIGIGAPVILFNLAISMFFDDPPKAQMNVEQEVDYTFALLGKASIITCVVLYIPVIFTYFSSYSQKLAIEYAIWINVGSTVNRIVSYFSKNNKKKNKMDKKEDPLPEVDSTSI